MFSLGNRSSKKVCAQSESGSIYGRKVEQFRTNEMILFACLLFPANETIIKSALSTRCPFLPRSLLIEHLFGLFMFSSKRASRTDDGMTNSGFRVSSPNRWLAHTRRRQPFLFAFSFREIKSTLRAPRYNLTDTHTHTHTHTHNHSTVYKEVFLIVLAALRFCRKM